MGLGTGTRDWDSGLGSPKKRYRDDKRKIIIKLEKETNVDVEQALFDPSIRPKSNIKTMITCGRTVVIKCCLLWFLLFV